MLRPAGCAATGGVFEAFLSGVRPARSTGLTLNKATAMELGARP